MVQSSLHMYEIAHWYHVVIKIGHDPQRTKDHEADDQNAEGKRQNVIRVVRGCGDVKEKHQMDSRLGNRQRYEGNPPRN